MFVFDTNNRNIGSRLISQVSLSSTYAGEAGCPSGGTGYCAAFGGDFAADPYVNGNGGAHPGLVNSGGTTTFDYYQVGERSRWVARAAQAGCALVILTASGMAAAGSALTPAPRAPTRRCISIQLVFRRGPFPIPNIAFVPSSAPPQVAFPPGPGYPGGFPTPLSAAVFVNRLDCCNNRVIQFNSQLQAQNYNGSVTAFPFTSNGTVSVFSFQAPAPAPTPSPTDPLQLNAANRLLNVRFVRVQATPGNYLHFRELVSQPGGHMRGRSQRCAWTTEVACMAFPHIRQLNFPTSRAPRHGHRHNPPPAPSLLRSTSST